MSAILIKNGRIWDGSKFFFGDVLTKDGVIERIAPDIAEEEGNYVFDATEMTVSAGLVDTHVHILGPEPDRYGIDAQMCTIPFGVTAAADAGGAHANRELAENYLVKNVTFVKVAIKNDLPDFAVTEEKLRLYGDNAIGVKVYFDVATKDVHSIAPLREICGYARDHGLKVMVHCSNSPAPMAQILETLAPGDILTHAFHGGAHTAADDGFAAIRAAKERGIVIDAGFAGHVHTDFGVLREAIAQGVLPDTVSTDITRASAYTRGGRYGMTMCMGMARAAGMEEEAVFRAVTATPAGVLGKTGQWGELREGGCADIAVLKYIREPFSLTDKAGNRLGSDWSYRCALTVANGTVVWRD